MVGASDPARIAAVPVETAVPLPLRALPERELIARWDPAEGDTPWVSVCCMAYNHADTVADAIEGMLAQRTDFPFEVLVQDDASTDDTAEVVRRYARSHPRVVTALLREENLYRRNGKTLGNVLPHARGRWIAVCEADDYWSDPEKLALQVAALRRTGAELSLHPAVEVDTRTGAASMVGRLAHANDLLRPGSTLRIRTPPYAAAVYARAALDRYEQYRDRWRPPLGDVFMMAFGSAAGGVAYLDRPMSVYRRYLAGSWTVEHRTDHVGAARHGIRMLTALDALAEAAPDLERDARARQRTVWNQLPRSLQRAITAGQLTRREARRLWPRGSRAPLEAAVARWAAITVPASFVDRLRSALRPMLRRAGRDGR
ncbi:MAG: glycosyltransferase family 2 protein [Gemmatimonadota bacterium]|nr:glycosyltransferase family 2 protein [Gemmatimonadota bacterium]